MTTAIDANVLSAFWLNELDSALLSSALNRCRAEGPLVISPFVYSELLACPGMSEGLLRTFANGIGMKIDFTIEERVWTEAGTSYHRHSRRDRVLPSAPPRRILADFLIGAHALLQADRLLTRNQAHFRCHFPELKLVDLAIPA